METVIVSFSAVEDVYERLSCGGSEKEMCGSCSNATRYGTTEAEKREGRTWWKGKADGQHDR